MSGLRADAAQRALDNAVAHFLAGERCSLRLRFGPYGVHDLDPPAIVSWALSVELALKVLHLLTSERMPTGHNLARLLAALPDAQRAALPRLCERGEKIAEAFRRWRYCHEHDLLIARHSDVRRAFIECHAEIRRLRPDLVSRFERDWEGFSPAEGSVWPGLLDAEADAERAGRTIDLNVKIDIRHVLRDAED